MVVELTVDALLVNEPLIVSVVTVDVLLVSVVNKLVVVSVSHFWFSKLKYLPGWHLHLYGAGLIQFVSWVKYWHSLFVDEFIQILP